MSDLLGLVIVLVADIYLMILLLHLLLDPRQFYLHPVLAACHQGAEPLLAPLRRVLHSPLLAVLAACLLVIVAKGLLLWVTGALGMLVISPALGAMSMLVRAVPVLAPIFMSLGFVVDWLLALVVISVAVSALVETHTHNPFGRFTLRILELGEHALGPLAPRLGEAWQTRLAVGAAAVLADALIQAFLLGSLLLLAGTPPSLGLILTGLGSAIYVSISWGFQFFVVLLFVAVVMSWLSPDPRNPLVQFIGAVSHPLLAPFRRYVPPIAGIDISPVFAIVLLVVARDVLLRLTGAVLGRWI